jgi:tetratricopeptide (TPR) repeat protein
LSISSRRGARAVVAFVVFALAVAASSPAWANDKSAPFVDDARRKLRAHDVPGALKALASAVAADPGDADAQILYQDVQLRSQAPSALLPQYKTGAAAQPDDPLLQYLATRLEKPDDAARDFDKLQSRFPESAILHEGRATALQQLARDAARDKDIATELEQAVAIGPRDPRMRTAQARNFERVGAWPLAIDTWKFALGMRPADRSIMLGLGEALRKSGALDEAVAQFETAAKLDPADPEPRYRIGLARRDADRHADALKEFDAAIALDKAYIDAYCAAMRTSLSLVHKTAVAAKREPLEAEFAPALGYGARAVQVDGQSVAAHMALAAAEEATSEIAWVGVLSGLAATPPAAPPASPPAAPRARPPAAPPAAPPGAAPAAPPATPAAPEVAHGENAMKEYDTVLGMVPATSPDRVAALLGKAYMLLLAGKFDEAVAAADKANDQDDHAMSSYLYGGRGLQLKGDAKDAERKFYEAGLKIAPDNAKLRHARGIALWQDNKVIEAKKDLEAAVQLDPKNGRFQLSLGEIYYELKNYPPAVTALVVATDALPGDVTAWRALGRACTGKKDFENAAAAYEQVVALLEPATGATPPDGATPPAKPPDPAKPDPPKPDPAKPDPNAPPKPKSADGSKPELATNEHLYLALLYADHLNDKDKAKAHAKKWVDQGGTNPNLDSYIQQLLADK